MERKNCLIGLAIVLAISLCMMPSVLAATVINSPVVDNNYTTTMNVSLTTAIANCLSCSFWYDSTGAGGRTLLGTIENTTDSQTTFENAVLSITSFSDSATYNISANCTGDTDEEAVAVNPITIDNTVPVVTLSVPLSGESESFGRVLDYKCSVSDAIGLGTSSISVAHPSGDDTTSTTLTVNSGDYLQFVDTDYGGDYVFTCTGTDYTGNTASSTATVTMGDLMGAPRTAKKKGTGTGINTNVLLLIGAIVVIYFVMANKKK